MEIHHFLSEKASEKVSEFFRNFFRKSFGKVSNKVWHFSLRGGSPETRVSETPASEASVYNFLSKTRVSKTGRATKVSETFKCICVLRDSFAILWEIFRGSFAILWDSFGIGCEFPQFFRNSLGILSGSFGILSGFFRKSMRGGVPPGGGRGEVYLEHARGPSPALPAGRRRRRWWMLPSVVRRP